MGRGMRTARELARHRRFLPGPNTPVYERVGIAHDLVTPTPQNAAPPPPPLGEDASSMEATGSAFEMSEEMREALAAVEVPEPAMQAPERSEEKALERLEMKLQTRRFNHGAPFAFDWRSTAWPAIQIALARDPPAFLNISNRLTHSAMHSDVMGFTPFEGMVACHSHYHPVAMLFQLFGRNSLPSAGRGMPTFSDSKGHSATIALAAVHSRITTTTSPQCRMLELSLARALYANMKKYRLYQQAGAYFFTSILRTTCQVEELEKLAFAVEGRDAHKASESHRAAAVGALVQLHVEVLQDIPQAEAVYARYAAEVEEAPADPSSKRHPADTLCAARGLIVHYVTQEGDEALQKRGWDLLQSCTVAPTRFLASRWALWLCLQEMASHPDVTYATARRMIRCVVPYLEKNPSLWSEELLEAVMKKTCRDGASPTPGDVEQAYHMLKQGANAGFPGYHPLIDVPPPRRGIHALLCVARRAGEPERAQRVVEFMLRNECRPAPQDVHELLVCQAEATRREHATPASRRSYRNLLVWLQRTHEVVVADQTLFQSFELYQPEGVADMASIAALALSLAGGARYELLRSIVAKALCAVGSPPRAYIEVAIFCSAALIRNAYSDLEFPVRIGCAEMVSAIADVFESENIPLNLLEEPLRDTHSHWSGGGYVIAKTRTGSRSAPAENFGSRGTDTGYTSAFDVTDAFLLSPYGAYDVTPAHTEIPDTTTHTRLLHWTALVWDASLEEALSGAGGAEGLCTVVPLRQLHHALRVLEEAKEAHLEALAQDHAVAPVALDAEFGAGVKQAVKDIRVSLRQVQARKELVITLVEQRLAVLGYAEEIELIASRAPQRIPLRVGGAPSVESFAACAAALAESGLGVDCLVESDEDRAAIQHLTAPHGVDVSGASPYDGPDSASPSDALREEAARVRRASRLWEFFPQLSRREPGYDVPFLMSRKKAPASVPKHSSRIAGAMIRETLPSDLIKSLPWKQA